MGTLHGYAGRLLRVDLSTERITEEKLDGKTARSYLGGTGLGARYLYEEVPAGIEWSSERNRIIVASGPLGGTSVGGSGTVSVVTKGPLTNGAAASQANGLFGAFLRFSGYDGIILQGRARRWVYLYVGDGKAELRDASHLVGKGTYETGDLIRSELGLSERGASIAAIGPAGEHLVKFACIVVDKGHIAAHNGTGAVMGSKNLKAIAVARGKHTTALKDKGGLSSLALQNHNSIANDPREIAGRYKWGTLFALVGSVMARDGNAPVRNYTTNVYDIEPEKLEKFGGPYIRGHFNPKPNPCWACRMVHCTQMTIADGPHAGTVLEEPEYEELAAWGPCIGNTDVTEAMVLSHEADVLGMDANEGSWVMGFVMECYEKGIINKTDCNGLEMNWGNTRSARDMLHRIATRDGLGDVLAEGVMRAAKHIGGDAPQFAIHTLKGNTPRHHDHRSNWPMLFDTCLAQQGTDEGYSMRQPAEVGLSAKPIVAGTHNSPEEVSDWNGQCKGAVQFEDSLGVCRFNSRTDLGFLSKAVSAATGWDYSAREAYEAGQRIVNLLRIFNLRHGHTAEMDAPSPRYGSAPPDGPSQGKTIMPFWNELRTKYYRQMGWDANTGKPLPDTLKRLGLEYAIPELWGPDLSKPATT